MQSRAAYGATERVQGLVGSGTGAVARGNQTGQPTSAASFSIPLLLFERGRRICEGVERPCATKASVTKKEQPSLAALYHP
jgi:hypothetical protein